MITAKEIKDLQLQEPFKPFALHLNDGRSFQIGHPEQILVVRNKIIVGLAEQEGIPDRVENCSILHIVSVEEIAA